MNGDITTEMVALAELWTSCPFLKQLDISSLNEFSLNIPEDVPAMRFLRDFSLWNCSNLNFASVVKNSVELRKVEFSNVSQN